MVDSRMTANEHFTARLPTKRVAADCLIFSPDGRFLLVEPTYKDTWDVPGGIAEIDESPRNAARREVAEELGLDLDLDPGALLAVDWVPRRGDWTECVAFLFDGGVFSGSVAGLTLPVDEIRSARFVTLVEAKRLMTVDEFSRISAALEGRSRRSIVYLENGRAVSPAE